MAVAAPGIAKRPVAAFLVMAYGVTVVVGLFPALTRRDLLPFDQAPYDWLGHFLGSALPAFIVVWALSRRAGARDLARRCLRWRVPGRWYLVALLGVPVGTILLASLAYGSEPLSLIVQRWPLMFTTVLPHLLVIIVFSNVAEEVGWTGFLLDRMQDRFSPMRAAVVTGAAFALAHLPGYVVEEGVAAAPILFGILVIPQIASRFIVAWIYNSTGRSILLVGLFHCAFNVTSADFSHEFIPGPRDEIFVFTSGLVVVLAAMIAIRTRGGLAFNDPSGK
ncbi:MAG TPA: type II CAAX endopeptidase family protein [Actinomycetota bacterium]|nr:type II CAAX endopeptidase family protein [Actinomycetota bacterium]